MRELLIGLGFAIALVGIGMALFFFSQPCGPYSPCDDQWRGVLSLLGLIVAVVGATLALWGTRMDPRGKVSS